MHKVRLLLPTEIFTWQQRIYPLTFDKQAPFDVKNKNVLPRFQTGQHNLSESVLKTSVSTGQSSHNFCKPELL